MFSTKGLHCEKVVRVKMLLGPRCVHKSSTRFPESKSFADLGFGVADAVFGPNHFLCSPLLNCGEVREMEVFQSSE